MVGCAKCGHEGSLAEFSYVAQAEAAGPRALRRCPACGELIIVDELEAQEDGVPSPRPWGLSGIWGRSLSEKDREVEK
jgi:hypothetical protein